MSHPWLTPYRARSGFLAPWQAEILAKWRYECACASAQSHGLVMRALNEFLTS